jgi:hypothetical protein
VPGKNMEGILKKVSGGKLYIKNPKTGETSVIFPGYGQLRSKESIGNPQNSSYFKKISWR